MKRCVDDIANAKAIRMARLSALCRAVAAHYNVF